MQILIEKISEVTTFRLSAAVYSRAGVSCGQRRHVFLACHFICPSLHVKARNTLFKSSDSIFLVCGRGY